MDALLLCLVVAISDGDTLKVRCGEPGQYQQITVRLSNVDAPEKGQAFGDRSKRSLSELCSSHQASIRPRTSDRYGRIVADVDCQGTDASRHQVSEGMAWVFDRYVIDRSLYEDQEKARAAHAGLWNDAEPVPPWEWRSRSR